jgi:tRNA1Val (adenine37-N6)-methyltransferase
LKKILPFLFKKFTIEHDRCAMKVGTDAVLLGSWVNVQSAKRILDVGTGSGVIALMLAQRSNVDTHVDAIEIEKEDARQAKENVLRSPWPTKISVFQESLQEFKPDSKYDLIVSNPPFFVKSLLPPTAKRTRTRHAEKLTYDDLITNSVRMMNSKATMAVVLPVQEGNEFRKLAVSHGLYLNRELVFYSRIEKPQERWLFEFGPEQRIIKKERLVLYADNDQKSTEYVNLTNEFYL